MGFVVVIPAYIDSAVMSSAIASALDQSGLEEVVVVDDGSTDLTLERAENFDGPIRCISQANAGPAAARNTGATSTKANYVVFLDADDVLLTGNS